MNSNQNNNRGKGGGNKRNMTAIVSILLWALVLTLLVNLATSRLQQANSVEVSYGQFRQLIMQDAVESVVMASGKYTFTLKEGYSLSVGEDGEVTVRTPEEGGQDSQAAQAPQESGTTGGVLGLPLLDGTAPQQQPVQSQNQAQSAGGRESLVYFCAPLTDDIPELVALMEAHGITNFGPEYVEPINPILSVLLSWVLPMVLIMVVFSLLMRGMAGKMGGGIGNLIDRVLNGEVVDYINLLFMRFAVFNFADICVCVGVALWVLVIFLEELHEDTKKGPKEQ